MVATIFTSLAFLSSSVSMTNLSRLVAASFSSLALLSSSVSMANLSCLLVTTFSSLKLLSNSLSSPRFHLLRVGRRCYSVVFCFLTFASYPQHTEAPFALTFSFLSERFFFVNAKAALAYSRKMNNKGVTGRLKPPQTYLEHARVWPRNSACAFWTTTDT